MRDDHEFLLDIKEAIEQINKYTVRGQTSFENDELVQTWVLRHLQIIGEASRQLSEDFRKRHSDIPWSKMIGMRNILVHRYFGIDPVVVWAVVENELPKLKEVIDTLLHAE
ncbi:DUF86 domain-containing protein [candidate division KSB1 bacterium]|nr:DUF86 domain-containing protein [candidate division KSB1 bacterium]